MTRNLTSGRTLFRGAAWNLLGQSLPVLAAFLFVPLLVRGLGIERFGILSLAWMLVGYFSLFDLGLGGALTRLVSDRLASHQDDEVPALVWTGLALTFPMGLVGGAVIAGLAPWLVGSALHIPPEMQGETLGLLRVLAVALPVVTCTAALSGTLAAQQRFGLLNAIRVPMGIFTYGGPLLVLPFSHSLLPVAVVLAGGRLLGGVAHFVACLVTTPGLRQRVRLERRMVRPLASFGGWMTVTSVISPLMVYLDRFFIGGVLTMAMVAYYTTPYDLTSRMWILCTPISSVLFPAFAACSRTDPARASQLFRWGLRAVSFLLLPVALLLGAFAGEILRFWLGADFALHSAPVLRLLAVGMYVNGLAMIALALVQASGRPDLGAKLHAAELPIYLVAVWLLIHGRGIEGAAIAWVGRVSVDAIALFLMAARRLPQGRALLAQSALAVLGGAALIAAGALIPLLAVRAVFAGVVLVGFAIAGWRFAAVPGRLALAGWKAGRPGT